MEPPDNHPLNLNSTVFEPEAYVSNLLKRKGLDELVAVEEDMVQNVRRLDAEMQQLVYENYNKFLTATNTVRNMQIEFSNMDEEMKTLTESMKQISTLSGSLNGVFNKHRENVRKLTDASKTVKSLQYVVKLPQKLQSYIDQKDYKRAVRTFAAVKPKLIQYKDIQSMAGIYNDSVEIMNQLEQQKFTTIEEMRESLTESFASKDRDWYRSGIHQFEEKLQKVVESDGEYF
uniref:Vacuolar protein sorting-associated protein 51 homolog n=1 Tax=Acrobeloides nanus TaxID=290746 RepID=A0A914C6A9_9BILA